MDFEANTSGIKGAECTATGHRKVSLAYQEDSSQDCPTVDRYLSSCSVGCRHRRRERATLAAMQGWAGRYHSSRRSPLIWTLETRHPSQAKQDRGLFASASRQSSCVAGLWVPSGAQPVFLPCSGTSGLLAILHSVVCRVGATNFRGRTCLVRRDIRCSLDAHDSASHSRARACSCPSSPGSNLRPKRA